MVYGNTQGDGEDDGRSCLCRPTLTPTSSCCLFLPGCFFFPLPFLYPTGWTTCSPFVTLPNISWKPTPTDSTHLNYHVLPSILHFQRRIRSTDIGISISIDILESDEMHKHHLRKTERPLMAIMMLRGGCIHEREPGTRGGGVVRGR